MKNGEKVVDKKMKIVFKTQFKIIIKTKNKLILNLIYKIEKINIIKYF